MTKPITVTFDDIPKSLTGTLAGLCFPKTVLGSSIETLDSQSGGIIKRAAAVEGFEGKKGTSLKLVIPSGLDKINSLTVLGTGDTKSHDEKDWLLLGGKFFSQIGKGDKGHATLLLEAGSNDKPDNQAIVQIALGLILASYKFDKYKTKKTKGSAKPLTKITIYCTDPKECKKLFKGQKALSEGIMTARDLVNEPANILGPEEFAKRIEALEKTGLEVEILSEKDMEKLGMFALLGVGMGSEQKSSLAIMRWNGNPKKKTKPLAFVGKGVTFDTGGISIKPSANMGDMKGDMGGAACVTGLMQTLALRKAKVNAVGVVGLVENMPAHNAQRPGDIVTSMSGQTIEVLNTDAEGRLVLADALWYTQDRFKPEFMVNLATLTGAIMVALGKEHAGLFSNNDDLSEKLTECGLKTDEKLWRMPLSKSYDKLINSKNADMKNIGGPYAGSITAGQFLQRYVNDTPWAHLDIAGTAMGSPQTDINKSWSSGFGVRLLNQLVMDHYEAT